MSRVLSKNFPSILLRLYSLIYLCLGVWVWVDILGIRDDIGYLGMTDSRQLDALIFCILYPIVGVGLWTTLLWGRVVWYLMIMVHIFLYLLSLVTIILLLFDILLILVFFCLCFFLRRLDSDVADVVSD